MENGANVNDPGGAHCHQTTPLMDAAINGHVDVVQFLVTKGADLARKNDKVILNMLAVFKEEVMHTVHVLCASVNVCVCFTGEYRLVLCSPNIVCQ